MDWGNVTADELLNALGEVDWASPRPLWEFVTRFSVPKTQSKWTSRLKCNVYYYRTNYLALLVLSVTVALARQPLGLLGFITLVAAAMCFNDAFVNAVNDVVIKGVRRVHPHTAAVLRSVCGGRQNGNLGGSSRKGKSGVRVMGLHRHLAVALLALAGLYLLYRGAAWLSVAWGVTLGLAVPAVHATLRSPNLKARLASDREEFRAVWRGYQADMSQGAPRYNYSL